MSESQDNLLVRGNLKGVKKVGVGAFDHNDEANAPSNVQPQVLEGALGGMPKSNPEPQLTESVSQASNLVEADVGSPPLIGGQEGYAQGHGQTTFSSERNVNTSVILNASNALDRIAPEGLLNGTSGNELSTSKEQKARLTCFYVLSQNPEERWSDEELSQQSRTSLELVAKMGPEKKLLLQAQVMGFNENPNAVRFLNTAEADELSVQDMMNACRFDANANEMEKNRDQVSEDNLPRRQGAASVAQAVVVAENNRSMADQAGGKYDWTAWETAKAHSNKVGVEGDGLRLISEIEERLKRLEALRQKIAEGGLVWNPEAVSLANSENGDDLNSPLWQSKEPMLLDEEGKKKHYAELAKELSDLIKFFTENRQQLQDIFLPDAKNHPFLALLGNVTEGVVGNAPAFIRDVALSLLVTYVTGGLGAPAIAGGVFVGAVSAADAYNSNRIAGIIMGLAVYNIDMTDEKQLYHAFMDPEISAGIEKIAAHSGKVGVLFSVIGSVAGHYVKLPQEQLKPLGSFFKELVNAAVSGGEGEVVNAFGRVMNQWMVDENKRPPYEMQKILLEAFSSADYPEYKAMYGMLSRYIEATRPLEVAQQRVDTFKQVIGFARSEGRNAGNWKQLARDALENSGVGKLYFSEEKLSEFNLLGLFGADAGENANDGFFAVSREAFLEKLAHLPCAEELVAHMKLTPEEMTLAQAQEYAKNEERNFFKAQERELARLAEVNRFYQRQRGGFEYINGYVNRDNYDVSMRANTEIFSLGVSSFYSVQHKDEQGFPVYVNNPFKVIDPMFEDSILDERLLDFQNSLSSQDQASTVLSKGGLVFASLQAYDASLFADSSSVDDFQTVLSWWGIHDVESWNRLNEVKKNQYLNQYANALQTYAVTGKVPYDGLGVVFDKNMEWLDAFYKSAPELDIKMSSNVRGVLESVKEARAVIGQDVEQYKMGTIFNREQMLNLGIPEERIAEYEQSGEEGRIQAKAGMTRRSVSDLQWLAQNLGGDIAILREQNLVESKRAELVSRVKAQREAMPVYQLIDKLQSGTLRFNAQAVDNLRKADKQILFNMTAFVGMGEMGWVVAGDDGKYDLDGVAKEYGFESGREMMKALADALSPHDKDQSITTGILLGDHGLYSKDASVQELMNDKLLHTQMMEYEVFAQKGGEEVRSDEFILEKAKLLVNNATLNGKMVDPMVYIRSYSEERQKVIELWDAMQALKRGEAFRSKAQVFEESGVMNFRVTDLKPQYASLLRGRKEGQYLTLEALEKEFARLAAHYQENALIQAEAAKMVYEKMENERARIRTEEQHSRFDHFNADDLEKLDLGWTTNLYYSSDNNPAKNKGINNLFNIN